MNGSGGSGGADGGHGAMGGEGGGEGGGGDGGGDGGGGDGGGEGGGGEGGGEGGGGDGGGEGGGGDGGGDGELPGTDTTALQRNSQHAAARMPRPPKRREGEPACEVKTSQHIASFMAADLTHQVSKK